MDDWCVVRSRQAARQVATDRLFKFLTQIPHPLLLLHQTALHQTIQSCELTERKFRLPPIPAPEEFHRDFAISLVPLLLSDEPPEDFPTYETLIKQLYWDSLLDYKDLLYEPNFKEYVDRVDQETGELLLQVVMQLAEGFSEYRDQTPQDKEHRQSFQYLLLSCHFSRCRFGNRTNRSWCHYGR